MTIARGTEDQPLTRRAAGEDAVEVVRRALERAEMRGPLFPGEEEDSRAAALVLVRRLKRLKAKGVEFGEIELSVYARQLLPGPGRLTLAS